MDIHKANGHEMWSLSSPKSLRLKERLAQANIAPSKLFQAASIAALKKIEKKNKREKDLVEKQAA